MNLGSFFQLEQQVQRAIIIALVVMLGLAVLVGGGATLYYRAEAADARLEAARCAADLAVEKANVVTLKGAVANQNKAVDALREETEKRVKDAEAARKRAEANAKVYEDRARGLMNATPDDANDLCGSALSLYRRSRK